jgi:integrase
MSEQERAVAAEKSAQKMHRHPKTAVAYWSRKVHKPAGSAHFNIQIQHRGERHRFPLETADKTVAAERARTRYLHLVANGWTATLEKYKQIAAKPPKTATIGQWLHAVKASADFRPSTFTNYANSIRQIASDIGQIGNQPSLSENGEPERDHKRRIIYLSKFNVQSGGHRLWISKVDSLPLSILTAEAVQRWKITYIARAGQSPDARRRAENSAASRLRAARSLFSAQHRKFASTQILLPDPLPFDGIELPKRGNTAYQSKIDAPKLIESARAELDGEPYKIFVLGMLCGLRKREIDLLTWAQVDFAKAVIRIERTQFFAPKSEDSVGEVDLDPELLALMRSWKKTATDVFVIESNRPARHETSRANYRCQPPFETLYAWLRKHGVTARKPLHELRKELGAILASAHGIFAAQSVLRHAQISTTAAYYADKKQRITAGLGGFLKEHSVASGASTATSQRQLIDQRDEKESQSLR